MAVVTTEDNKLFCFGLGYTACRLAQVLIGKGWSISGTTRDYDKGDELQLAGVDTFITQGDGFESNLTPELRGSRYVLVSVPPQDDGDLVTQHYGGYISALPGLRWLGYLSSTAVYGDHGGAWVDESTPPVPSSEIGGRRLAAEESWLALWRERGIPVHVFRLAGIYGPGRSALDRVRVGTARRIVKSGHVLSRIHVDDITSVLVASMARPRPGAIYNLSDDQPASAAEVTEFAAKLLGAKPPPEISYNVSEITPEARRFFVDHRRVRNNLIKTELGISLRYPNYEKGLRAIATSEVG